MTWQFLAVLFSGWLYVDASYRGPRWQRWVFKPVTLLLLLLWALGAPQLGPAGYLILLGLFATLVGDILLMLPHERLLYALGAFFLSHLLYTLSFISQMTLTFFWPLPLTLLVLGAVLLATSWNKLGEMRWPIVACISMTLLMVWIAGEHYFLRSTDTGFTLFAGASLLLISSIIWLLNRYHVTFRAADAIVAASYFAGHFLIVRSLVL